MAGVSLQQFNSLNDHLLTFRFLLKFGQIPGGPDGYGLTLRCQQCDVPGSTVEATPVGLHGFESVQPGRHISSHTMSATFVEGRDGIISSTLFAWQNFCRNNETGNAAASRFGIGGNSIAGLGGGGGGYVIPKVEQDIFNESGEVAVRNIVTNVWMQDRPQVQLDGSNSGLYLVQATFQYDLAYPVAGSIMGGRPGQPLGTALPQLG